MTDGMQRIISNVPHYQAIARPPMSFACKVEPPQTISKSVLTGFLRDSLMAKLPHYFVTKKTSKRIRRRVGRALRQVRRGALQEGRPDMINLAHAYGKPYVLVKGTL